MAFDAFMKVHGVPGDSTADNHKDWIELVSFGHGLTQHIGGARSSGGAATSGRVDHSDFTVSKQLDKASPMLHLLCCNGKHIPQIEIELCRASEDAVPFMRYILSDVVISSVTPSGMAGSTMPTENLAFNYGKIEWEYTATDPSTGSRGGAVKTFWDTEKNSGG